MVISIGVGKGGPGKTTFAHIIAGALAAEGLRVIVTDTDSQGDSMLWAQIAQSIDRPLPYEVTVVTDITRWVRRNRDEWDVIVIDGDPKYDQMNRAAARAADVVVIPSQDGIPDVHKAVGWVRYCESVGTPAIIVLNHVRLGGADEVQAREFLAQNHTAVATLALGHWVGVKRNFGSPPGRLLINVGRELLGEITEHLKKGRTHV